MRNLIFTIVFAAVCSVSAFAEVNYYYTESDNGQYLFFKRIDNEGLTLISVYEAKAHISGINDNYQYSGDIIIPLGLYIDDEPVYVDAIGEKAFVNYSQYNIYNNTGLSSVVIPNSVTSIGDLAFQSCTAMESITIGNSVTEIGMSAFVNCHVNRVNYLGNVAGWCRIIFSDSDSNPLSIAHDLYINNELVTNLIIPETITEISNLTFRGASCITSVTIPGSVTSIGAGAFSDCRITKINFNATNCTYMGTIDYPIFGNRASTVVSLSIGENVTNIPSYAFKGIPNIDTIKVAATMPPSITYLTFDNDLSMYVPVLVPCGTVSTYENADFWDNFRRIHQSPDCGSTDISDEYMSELSIFPNPTNSILNISSSETISEIEIVNTLGQVVKRFEVNGDNAVCNVEELKAGVYVVRIRTLRYFGGAQQPQAQGAVLRKFVKE